MMAKSRGGVKGRGVLWEKAIRIFVVREREMDSTRV
jgi:hypothetical protein